MMKYVCRVCGYVYDDHKQALPFEQLPDDWTCPLCGAPRSEFEANGKEEEKKQKPKEKIVIDEDMQKLSIGELSAVCSNLARGCEKQY
ncbi:MAG TPA: rubredoxin, partial [Candidatus Dorea intestinavium]|nr:rubredoxin [Candidatus Dorea intestinavium]